MTRACGAADAGSSILMCLVYKQKMMHACVVVLLGMHVEDLHAVFELYRGLWGSPLFFYIYITGGGGGFVRLQ